jgi:hypothetical protein
MREAMMRIRLILCLICLVALSQVAPAFVQGNIPPTLSNTIDELVQTTAALRGLEPKVPIREGVKSKEEISRYLNETVQKENNQEELEKEGRVLRKLGLVPADLDYRDFIIKLLTEQVGGFYDPDAKTLYIASWLPAEEQKPVIIHEITHALQDQYFDVERIRKKDQEIDNDDRTLAHQAVMEGDAMVVMLQSLLDPIKRHFSELPNLAFIMQSQMSTMQFQYPTFKSAPPYLQETLIFPYGYGASFLQYSWKQVPSWQAVNKIYSDLPSSTEQIIHPEKYFVDRDAPKQVTADAYAAMLGDNWKIAYKNVMGEFSLGLLLKLHLTEEWSQKAVTGWGGDQVLLLENDKGKDAVLVDSVWDTSDDAEKFFAAMNEWFRRHNPKVQRLNETPAGFSLIHNGELSSIKLDGSSVRFIIGLPEAEAQKLKNF